MEKQVPEMDRENVEYLVIAEVRRLHEGVLVRYGLSRSEFSLWQAQQYEF
ncbi:hypothetical protein [Candidatus Regiella insecticola]|nr:hypothetical protein [Candidatus Regiella insecticola]